MLSRLCSVTLTRWSLSQRHLAARPVLRGHVGAVPAPQIRLLGTAVLQQCQPGLPTAQLLPGRQEFRLGSFLISSGHCLQGTDTMDTMGYQIHDGNGFMEHPTLTGALALRILKGLSQL